MSNLNLINLSVSEMLDAFKSAYYDRFSETMKIGSDEMAVSSIMSYCLAVFFSKANDKFKQRFIDTATGEYLDAIALMYGITSRPSGARATTLVEMNIHESADVYVAGTIRIKDQSGHIFENAIDFSYSKGHQAIPFRAIENGSTYNGIPIGALNEFVDEMPTDTLSNPINISITSGGLDSSVYADDNVFREWLKNEIASFAGCGTAQAYRGKAMNVDSRIWDVFVLEQGQEGYERGKVQVFVLVDDSQVSPNEIVPLVRDALQDPAFRPVGDFVVVERAMMDGRQIDGTCHITYPSRFRTQAYDRTVRVYQEYRDDIRRKIGKPFVYGDYIKRLLVKDADGIYATEAVFTNFGNEQDGGDSDANQICFAPVYPNVSMYLEVSPINFVLHFDDSDN